MHDVALLHLSGEVPQLRIETLAEDAAEQAASFREQLDNWGFMALEVPGIGARVDNLYRAFSGALTSIAPSLSDFSVDRMPQASSGGNHGFFTFGSEVPRLAKGTADPKEFMHVSGAMLDNHPAGSAEVFEAFPALGSTSRQLFSVGFTIATALGEVIRESLAVDPPKLGLSAYSSILRMIHYRDAGDREVLAHEHSGIQMLGVQFPPSDGGLQYILNDGTWVEPVIWGTDVLLCNIGRMLSEASGRRFRPSTHRVHRSAAVQGEERWSSVVFVHPGHGEQQWRVNGDTVDLLDVTWGDFVNTGLRQLGLQD